MDVAITLYPERTADPSLEVASGLFRYRDVHALTLTLNSGSWDETHGYRLVIKRANKPTDDPIALVTDFTIASATVATCEVNLTVDALGTYLGDQPNLVVRVTVRDTTDDSTLGQTTVAKVWNNTGRADDSAPDNPSANTYTDAEINNMVAGTLGIATAIGAADAVDDPTDAGLFATVISGTLKKITWANMKAKFWTYVATQLASVEIDIKWTDATKGPVIRDRTSGNYYRLISENDGEFFREQVT